MNVHVKKSRVLTYLLFFLIELPPLFTFIYTKTVLGWPVIPAIVLGAFLASLVAWIERRIERKCKIELRGSIIKEFLSDFVTYLAAFYVMYLIIEVMK